MASLSSFYAGLRELAGVLDRADSAAICEAQGRGKALSGHSSSPMVVQGYHGIVTILLLL